MIRNPACKYLFLLCGFYCITEHGLQNWLVTYGSDYLGYTVPQAARYLSFFFGGIMAGRLLFAPLVQKCGIMRSMRVFVAAAGVLYVSGMLLERRGMLLLCGSGLAFSILWPTIVLLIGRYYDPGLAGTATGFITGFATLFDVAFNACFGKLIDCHSDSAGFHASAVPELLPAPDPGAKIQGNFVEIAQIEVPYSLDTGHFLQTYIICD